MHCITNYLPCHIKGGQLYMYYILNYLPCCSNGEQLYMHCIPNYFPYQIRGSSSICTVYQITSLTISGGATLFALYTKLLPLPYQGEKLYMHHISNYLPCHIRGSNSICITYQITSLAISGGATLCALYTKLPPLPYQMGATLYVLHTKLQREATLYALYTKLLPLPYQGEQLYMHHIPNYLP